MSDDNNQGGWNSWFRLKSVNLSNRISPVVKSPTVSVAYHMPDIDLFAGPTDPADPLDDQSMSVEPPQVPAYNLASHYSPAPRHNIYESKPWQVGNSHSYQQSVQVEVIREEQLGEQGSSVETRDASALQDQASPSPSSPEAQQAVKLFKQVETVLDTVPSASGPEPPLSITIEAAEANNSQTSQSNDDIFPPIVEYWRNINSLAPPVPDNHLSSPLKSTGTRNKKWSMLPSVQQTDTVKPEGRIAQQKENGEIYDINKPTCTLNLVCYRSGAAGCDLQQLHCILRSKFSRDEGFLTMASDNPDLIFTDGQFFREMRRVYKEQMCGVFRRCFSLKSLRSFRILSYAPAKRPIVVPFDDFILQEIMYAYRNPGKLGSSDDWIQWVFRLRRKDRRHALEFVEGWDTTRIAIAGIIPWLSSCLVGILWTATGGDPQTAFTIASFILTSSSIILALLAIISSIESSGKSVL